MKETATIYMQYRENQEWMSDILHTLEGCLYQHKKAFYKRATQAELCTSSLRLCIL